MEQLLALLTVAFIFGVGAALTADRDTKERTGDYVVLDAAASTKIYAGSLVAEDDNGRAVPAADTAGLKVIGRAEEYVDNSLGAAGDKTVKIKRRGVFKYANSGTDALADSDIDSPCFAEDDQTVGRTSTNLIVAGKVIQVDSDGVWVDVDDKPDIETVVAAIGGIAATEQKYLITAPFDCYIHGIKLVSDTATTGSDGSNKYDFQIQNLTAAQALLATAKSTSGGEITADAAYGVTADQNNDDISAGDVIELQVTKTGTPTALTTAEIVAQVIFHRN